MSSLVAILPSTMRWTMCQWSSSVSVSRHTSGVSTSFDATPTSSNIHECSVMSARVARWLGSRTNIFRITLQCIDHSRTRVYSYLRLKRTHQRQMVVQTARYGVSQKRCNYTHAGNIAKCRPIFIPCSTLAILPSVL